MNWLADYLLKHPGATTDYKAEWEWQRYQVGGKMFAATMCPGPQYDPCYAQKNLLNLKCNPEFSHLLRLEHGDIMPAFYMDKRSWISLNLDGHLPRDLIQKLVDDSYQLVFHSLTKKLQKELLAHTSN